MEFRVLGPMEVLADDAPVDVTGAKRRALVAMLALRPGQAHARDVLTENLWDGAPPPGAANTLKAHVFQLRKALAADTLKTTPAGYALDVGRGDVDATRFEDAVRSSSALPDSEAQAVANRLDAALKLWRGPALAEFTGSAWAQLEATRLESLREGAIERWIDARLALGEHAALVPELETRVGEYPLRERFWSQLMLALYRCGRQADALRAYTRLRRLLADELGIDPGRDIVELEAAILAHSPDLDWTPTTAGTAFSGGIDAANDDVASCTLVLTDIEGSTRRWERYPREMARALARHDEIVAEAVRAAHGTLVKTRGEGDSTFSVFRLASDAVNAAVALHGRLGAEPWPDGAELRVRIALHTGEVELRAGDYYGTTVNRAARLRSLASGGQILLSATTAGLVADALPLGTALIDMGLRPLRDLTRPEHIFELSCGHGGAPDALAVEVARPALPSFELAPHHDAPFVGRADELKALADCWDSACAGRRRLAFVAGEPGVGKSRLAAEVARDADEKGGLVLYGRWDEEPIAPFQGFLAALTSFAEVCPPSALLEDVAPLAQDLAPLFPTFAPLATSPWSARPSSETERFRLFEAIDQWLRRIAARWPLMLVLDDLHWADRPSLLLLRHLVRSAHDDRIMILGAYRDTDVLPDSELSTTLADLRRVAQYERVDVEGFLVDDVAMLLEELAGHDVGRRGREFARVLVDETSGNPYFVRELVRHLVDTGTIREEEGRWGSTVGVDEVGLPDSIREMVGWRLARLSPGCAELLRCASVVGQDFPLAVVGEVAGVEEELLLELVEEAERARVVHALARSDDRYAFAHAVVRHALYDGLSRARRGRLHRPVAEVLERAGANNPRRLGELAYHYCMGADASVAPKAVQYARAAGDGAMEQLAFEAAVDHYGRAIDVLDRFGGDAVTRCEVLLAEGEAHNRAGRLRRGKDAFAAAAVVARQLDRTDLLARAALGYGGTLPSALEPDERAEQLLEEVLERLDPADVLVRARALGRLAQWSYFVAPASVRASYCEEAVALARDAGDRRTLAMVLTSRCWALEGPEDLEGQFAVADELIALGESLDDGELVLQGLKGRLHRLFEQGDFDAAESVVARMRDLAGSLRQPEYLRLVTMWDGMLAGTRGRFDEAARLMAATVSVMTGHPQQRRVLYFQALPWRRLREGVSDGLPLVEQAAQSGVPLWFAMLAWFNAENGDADAARAAARRIDLRALSPAERRFDWWLIVAGLAIAVHATADTELAQELYAVVLPYRDRNCTVGQTAFFGAVAHYLGLLSTTTGDYDAAVAHFDDALTRHRAMSAAPFVAMTQVAMADALAARNAPGDDAAARQLRDDAAPVIARLELTALAAQAPSRREHARE